MSGDATPNLDLVYLDANQSQPEVKINDAWNKIDAAVAGLTVESDHQSPAVSVPNVRVLRFRGATVISESDGVVEIEISSGGGGGGGGSENIPTLTVIGQDSPEVIVSDVTTLRFSDATVEHSSDGSALVICGFGDIADQMVLGNISGSSAKPTAIELPQNMESAGWNSTSGAILLALAVPQDILIPYACTLREVYILTQGGAGSCTVNLWKTPIGSFPPTIGNDITGGTSPAIAASTVYTNSALVGWTKNFAQNDVIRCTLASVSTFSSVKIILRMY